MNKKILGILGLLVVLGGVALYIYRGTKDGKDSSTTLAPGINMTGDGTVTNLPLDNQSLPVAPSLDRTVAPLATLAPAVVKAVQAQMVNTITALKKDSTNANNWVELGGQRKTLGDYAGAAEAWEYARVLTPTNYIAWNNLGDLYHFFLKDYTRSEKSWKQVIALNPEYVQGYRGIVDLYMYSMKEKIAEIPTILKTGITKAPDAVDLQIMLAHYYESAGMTGSAEQAKTAYRQAIATAERLGNSALVESLKAALAAIK